MGSEMCIRDRIASYLRRISSRPTFIACAVDITHGHISNETKVVLRQLNASLEKRMLAPHGAWQPNAEDLLKNCSDGRRHFDLCFIDGDHSHDGVLSDYQDFAPRCRMLMFHDIQSWDLAIGMRDKQSVGGSVPLFWARLSAHLPRSRIVEITEQVSDDLPLFGIGLVLPGSAAPMSSVSWHRSWSSICSPWLSIGHSKAAMLSKLISTHFDSGAVSRMCAHAAQNCQAPAQPNASCRLVCKCRECAGKSQQTSRLAVLQKSPVVPVGCLA